MNTGKIKDIKETRAKSSKAFLKNLHRGCKSSSVWNLKNIFWKIWLLFVFFFSLSKEWPWDQRGPLPCQNRLPPEPGSNRSTSPSSSPRLPPAPGSRTTQLWWCSPASTPSTSARPGCRPAPGSRAPCPWCPPGPWWRRARLGRPATSAGWRWGGGRRRHPAGRLKDSLGRQVSRAERDGWYKQQICNKSDFTLVL